MSKHKAPTQITIASIQQESPLQRWVDRYWKLAVVAALGASVAILVPRYLRAKAQREHHGTWDDFAAQASLGGGFAAMMPQAPPATLALFADQNRESPVGAWAKALEVGTRIKAAELPEAEKAAQQLAAGWPGHMLSTARIYPGGDGAPLPLADAVRSRRARLDAWEKEHAFLFSNPELPTDAPRVRLNTSKGPIVVGLYVDRAPRHAENFLQHCRSGAYAGTKFHRVVRGSLVQGGDPNTISGEPDSWGLGGVGDSLELEIDPRLHHFKGSLAAWKEEGATRSHGSQFFLTTTDQNEMDGKTVVFGRVLEGESTLETIESGAVVGERPQDPAVIESVEVL
jgi:cyclophilin family peptidyl-prolyl cis-trans isomerase